MYYSDVVIAIYNSFLQHMLNLSCLNALFVANITRFSAIYLFLLSFLLVIFITIYYITIYYCYSEPPK